MTSSKALHISRFRLHALQKAKRVERANGDRFEAHHMCFTQRQLFEYFASDWRQDIDTARAALRMTSSTTSGFDNMGTCEDATSVVVAFMRFETKRCRSG